MSQAISERKHDNRFILLVDTNNVAAQVNPHEMMYNVKTSQREYVRYLNCTLNVLMPNKMLMTDIDSRDTSFDANSLPSGCGADASIIDAVIDPKRY